jgi:pyruvate,water dikinase
LICEVTPPSLVTLLPRLSGVIARYGSAADHFASVSREFGVPVLVQAGENCVQLKNGEPLTLWAEKQAVYGGVVKLDRESAGASQRLQESPFFRTLKMVIDFTSPLGLVDPLSHAFCPENCRSLHDILRFTHEKSVQAMFIQSTDGLLRKPKGAQLRSDIPLQIHIIDLGGGLVQDAVGKAEITNADLRCRPLQALLQGLSNPGVTWRDRAHFDWQSYDSIALAGGVATKSGSSLTSFCLVSSDYLNVNIRFGYHFTQIDSLCGENPDENYILMRFAGGGGNSHGKDLRLIFIAKVLARLNFTCEQTGELLDARLMRYDKTVTADSLDQVGRLLGAVRLLDMVLTDDTMIASMVEDFFRGKYDFSNE